MPEGQRIESTMIHHVGYVVDDLHEGIAHLERVFGAGPFTIMDNVQFDELEFDGQPATVVHSSAFGMWGGQLVELQAFEEVKPEEFREKMVGRGGSGMVLNHIAVAVPDADSEVGRLTSLGYPGIIRARSGPFQMCMHDTLDEFGFLVEVHRSGPEFDAFFTAVRSGGAER